MLLGPHPVIPAKAGTQSTVRIINGAAVSGTVADA
jgi:hypothetical protein